MIVDLAAEQGGNCEASEAGREVMAHGARVVAPVNLAASIPYHASQLYAKNLANFVQNMARKGELVPASDDEIVRDSMLTRGGQIVARPRARGARPRAAARAGRPRLTRAPGERDSGLL